MYNRNKNTNEYNLLPVIPERDWIEDFPHENGNYINECCECGCKFFGHKRRVICKLCY